tara:strand:- start:32 stop:511 length:480 start_codon:yes stop_codon:yes gene_type:complete
MKSRFDSKETNIIKRLLQFYLPEKIRNKIMNLLFTKILNIELNDFSKILYMNKNQVKEMYSEKMCFGSHGDFHYFLGKLNKKDQEKEIKNSINFFKKLKFDTSSFSICYPSNSYNSDTLKLLTKYNIDFGLTAFRGRIDKNNISNNLIYPRFDANDFSF